MHRLVKEAQTRTQALLQKHASACKTLNDEMPEITVALHRRVEAFIKELQLKLEDAENTNRSLTQRLEVRDFGFARNPCTRVHTRRDMYTRTDLDTNTGTQTGCRVQG
jgi:DNA replication initiation complex subunit (GINS family)